MALLLCDLDDTLVDRAGAFVHWAERFLQESGLTASGLAWLIEQDRSGYRSRVELFASVRARFGLETRWRL